MTTRDDVHPYLKVMTQVVEGLAEMLGPGVEVLVNEFSHPQDALVAIAGDVTGRKPGAPLSDMVLKLIRQGKLTENMINYTSQAPDGREIKSSTILVRDDEGQVLGCLCFNIDLTHWKVAKRLIDFYCKSEPPEDPVPELFKPDVESMLDIHIQEVLEQSATPVSLMKKDDKLKVVQELDERGIFMIRGSVSRVANALNVSRYTIYNYLDEIKAQVSED
ncbi:MAG: PAS domain-containing protein [Anaerolineales bacterium]|nr:PAS domain-containing protein [Anaerolineales bacterium]